MTQAKLLKMCIGMDSKFSYQFFLFHSYWLVFLFLYRLCCRNRVLEDIGEEIFELFPIIKDFLKRKGGNLSGGQQQQLAIARALVSHPKLLILDEPTEGIQPSIIEDIATAIQRVNRELGITILIVEQYLDFVLEVSNSYYVMDKGSITLSGLTKDADSALIQSKMAIG